MKCKEIIYVNEKEFAFPAKETLTAAGLAAIWKPDADVFIVNGYPALAETVLQAGDHCWLIRRGERPTPQEMDRLLHARHTPGVHEKVKKATVGVMGLGGLGSVVALALARIGIGRLLLADFDVVEPSNLNRQHYFIHQIGMKKTVAIQENIAAVNPYVAVDILDVVLTEKNIPEFFKEVDVLAECFDAAALKAAGLRAALTRLPGVGYVGASGLAGYGDNNSIQTKKMAPRVYIVGDGESAARPGEGLMAPRVGIAAHHQANQILRILLGVAE